MAVYIGENKIGNVAVKLEAPELIEKTVTENGTYDASDDNADGYSSVTVNVAGGGNLQPSKSFTATQNGTFTVSPDSGYDGIESVSITVSIPEYDGEVE